MVAHPSLPFLLKVRKGWRKLKMESASTSGICSIHTYACAGNALTSVFNNR